MKVKAYFNLHKKIWSVVALEGEHKGRVIAHATSVMIDNVEYRVSQAGRNRVLKEQRKNVHAAAHGDLAFFTGDALYPEYEHYPSMAPNAIATTGSAHVTYNPYKFDCFVTSWSKTKQYPVSGASRSFLTSRGVLAWGAKVIEEQVRPSFNQYSLAF